MLDPAEKLSGEQNHLSQLSWHCREPTAARLRSTPGHCIRCPGKSVARRVSGSERHKGGRQILAKTWGPLRSNQEL